MTTPVADPDTIIDPADLAGVDAAPARDSAPRRGPGRPKGSRNKTTVERETLNGVSGEPTPRPTRGRPRGRMSTALVKQQCATLVGLANLGVVYLARDDALSEPEMALLSDAVADEAMSSERIMRWLSTAGKVTPHIALAGACVTIAIPRLQRRGLFPKAEMTPEQEAAIREHFANANRETSPETARSGIADTSAFAVPVETRGAYGIDGANG